MSVDSPPKATPFLLDTAPLQPCLHLPVDVLFNEADALSNFKPLQEGCGSEEESGEQRLEPTLLFASSSPEMLPRPVRLLAPLSRWNSKAQSQSTTYSLEAGEDNHSLSICCSFSVSEKTSPLLCGSPVKEMGAKRGIRGGSTQLQNSLL